MRVKGEREKLTNCIMQPVARRISLCVELKWFLKFCQKSELGEGEGGEGSFLSKVCKEGEKTTLDLDKFYWLKENFYKSGNIL